MFGEVWYAVENTLIGGWCILTDDVEASAFDPSVHGRWVADFSNEYECREVVLLHNWFNEFPENWEALWPKTTTG